MRSCRTRDPHDWQGCFAEWSDAIAAHIGRKRDLVVASFSTTGPIERAAFGGALQRERKPSPWCLNRDRDRNHRSGSLVENILALSAAREPACRPGRADLPRA
jgi:hypothetical protein